MSDNKESVFDVNKVILRKLKDKIFNHKNDAVLEDVYSEVVKYFCDFIRQVGSNTIDSAKIISTSEKYSQAVDKYKNIIEKNGGTFGPDELNDMLEKAVGNSFNPEDNIILRMKKNVDSVYDTLSAKLGHGDRVLHTLTLAYGLVQLFSKNKLQDSKEQENLKVDKNFDSKSIIKYSGIMLGSMVSGACIGGAVSAVLAIKAYAFLSPILPFIALVPVVGPTLIAAGIPGIIAIGTLAGAIGGAISGGAVIKALFQNSQPFRQVSNTKSDNILTEELFLAKT